jgi:hypothetical protein
MTEEIVEKESVSDQDSPWKDIIESYFPEFMTFFLPNVAEKINWARGYEFLDKELQKVVRLAVDKRRYVDKLVKVWDRTANKSAWILLHIEVQGQSEADFALRMYTYQYRIFDRYRRKVATFVIFTDDSPTWKPTEYHYSVHGSELIWRYTAVKLIEYQSQWDKLEADRNPFAIVVMAHLQTLQTRKDDAQRYFWKSQIIRSLYKRGHSATDVFNLFRFIDWLMLLPPQLEAKLDDELSKYEEEQKMPYISRYELRAMEKGEQKGRIEGEQKGRIEGEQKGRIEGEQKGRIEGEQKGGVKILLQMLQRRYGTITESLQTEISSLSLAQLEELGSAILEFNHKVDLIIWLEGQVGKQQ